MVLKHILFLALLLVVGCDATSALEFEPEYVVEAYLEAGKPLPHVRVSRTVSVDAPYSVDDAGVSGAAVRIHLMSSDGSVENTYHYRPDGREGGVYQPPLPVAEVIPLRTYELVVEVPEASSQITSRTTVPDTFRIVHANLDRVVFQSETPLTFQLSRPFYPGRQSVFVFSTFAAGEVDDLTPFARGLFDTGDVTLQDLRQRASPILNEENFERLPNGDLRVHFPWLAVYFYGHNQIRVQAVDDNLHDFFRSQMVQQGGSTLPPGEIPNVLEHVEGGRGVFGSYSAALLDVFVERGRNQ